MFTLEVYKKDRRYKTGTILVSVEDHADLGNAEETALFLREQGYEVKVFETMVTKTNAMTGEKFQERYDTPYYCSPSSETYWSN